MQMVQNAGLMFGDALASFILAHIHMLTRMAGQKRLFSLIHSGKRVRRACDAEGLFKRDQSPGRRGDRPRGQDEVKRFSLRLEMNVGVLIPAVQ